MLLNRISFDYGAKLVCGKADAGGIGRIDGCTYELDPLVWYPAALVTGDYGYSIGAGGGAPLLFAQTDMGKAIMRVMLPFWFILAYVFSCLISFTTRKVIMKLKP